MSELPAGLAISVGALVLAIHFAAPFRALPFAAFTFLLFPYGLLWSFRTVMIRLHFSRETFAVTVGPWRRSIKLDHLSAVDYKRTGYTAKLALHDRSGGEVAINIRRFTRDDEWARLILDAVGRNGVALAPAVRELLEHADGTGRGWVA